MAEQQNTETKAKRTPRYWFSGHAITLCATALTLLVAWLPPEGRELLLLKRSDLFHGEIWRLWTGHFVHFGWSHLAWDLGTFLLAGLWLETLGAKRLGALLLLLLAPALSLGLLLCCPGLVIYGGLSGLVCAQVSALALLEFREGRRPLALLLCLALGLKLFGELWTGQASLGQFSSTDIRNVPAAHALGIVLGVGLALWKKAWQRH